MSAFNQETYCICGDAILEGDRAERWNWKDGDKVLSLRAHEPCNAEAACLEGAGEFEWCGAYYLEDDDEGRARCRDLVAAARGEPAEGDR